MSKPVEEKRKETRFPINSTVKITLPSGQEFLIGTCRNISGSGMLIRTEKFIDPATAISIEIVEGKIDFNADAVVVRTVEENGEFLVAVKVQNQN